MSFGDHLKVRVRRERDPETRKSNLCLQPSEAVKWWLGILSALIVAAVLGVFGLFVSALTWAHEIDSGQDVIVTKIEEVSKASNRNSDRLDKQDDRLRNLEMKR